VLFVQGSQFFIGGYVLMDQCFFLRLHFPSLPRLKDRP
jgi:hypothetical protein